MARAYKRSGPSYGVRRRYSAKRRSATTRSALVARNRTSTRNYRSSGYIGRFSGRAGELKFFDQEAAIVGIPTSGVDWELVGGSTYGIPQGTGPTERIGRKITLKKIMVRGYLKNVASGSSAQTSDVVRMILFQDTQANGAAAHAADVLESATWNSFNNLENSQRFKILKDCKFNMNTMAGAGWSTQAAYTEPAGVAATPNGGGFTSPATGNAQTFAEAIKNFEVYLNVNIPVQYTSTTGEVTEITSNNIHLAFLSAESHTQVSFKWRLRYEDN